jgi:hypothetical protein
LLPAAFQPAASAQQRQRQVSVSSAVRVTPAFHFVRSFVVRALGFLQVPPQVHIQGNGHAHYNERTDAQDQKPPDHPHNRLA